VINQAHDVRGESQTKSTTALLPLHAAFYICVMNESAAIA
jgi:hypothetical protein